MTNKVRIKRRASGGGAGAPTLLENAELAYNEQTDIGYYGKGTGGANGSATSAIPAFGSGAFVDLTSAQAINGTKTFGSSPIIPTPPQSDNSTAAASTAFVKSLNYLQGNQNVSVTGDATGSGNTTINLTLAATGVSAGTYTKVTIDAKGRATGATNMTSADVVASLGFTPINNATIGAANGVAGLGSDGKVPLAQLPSSTIGGMNYVSTWDASANSPAIPAAETGNKGNYYTVSVNGSTSIDGIAEWKVGDWIVSNGVVWDKIDNTESVTTVAGRTGAIVLVAADIGGLGALATANASAFVGNMTGTVTGNVTGSADNITGTLAVANGGTGLVNITAGALLKGNATGALLLAVEGVDYLSPNSTVDGGTY